MMTEAENRIIEHGKQVERLMGNKDFKEVILGAFIEKQGLDIVKSFDGSKEQLDSLIAIERLSGYLSRSIDNARMTLEQQKHNKGL